MGCKVGGSYSEDSRRLTRRCSPRPLGNRTGLWGQAPVAGAAERLAHQTHRTMSHRLTPADLGQPDPRVVAFQLCVHGCRFSGFYDHYDRNWGRVTVHCCASGASACAPGAILMVTDIAGFCERRSAMLSRNFESAVLDPLELELTVTLSTPDRLAHICA
jgi:hypothetical protein